MKNKFLAILIAVCTILLSFGIVNVSAATSGTCGDNLTWVLDKEGTLTISGRGAMTDWGLYTDEPWYLSVGDIKKVVIADGVTSIGEFAFGRCVNLTSITVPDSVVRIGESAFYNCISLTDIVIPKNITIISKWMFADCDGLTNIVIPDHITSIDSSAFANCDNLKNVTIPGSVTSIGSYAFEYCNNLENVIIPESVTTIGESAFGNCSSMKNIIIPNSITHLANSVFSRCNNLASITIPNTVTTISNRAFYYCDSLTDVYYDGTEEEWNQITVFSNNECLTNATIHFKQDIQERYHINDISIKDMSGNTLQEIPQGLFLATISFTNVSSTEDTVIILAEYTETDAFKGLMYIQTEDVPAGSTIKLSIPVDNSKGDIATLKAFCWESFGSSAPMGNSVSFPVE